MRRRRSLTLPAAALSALALIGLPAGAADGDCRVIREAVEATETTPAVEEVSVCRQDTFLQGGTPLANIGAASGAVPGWSTDQPDGAATSRYAALRPIDMVTTSPQVRPTFTGTYTGVLDNIAIDLFVSSPVYQATGTAKATYNRLIVDGVQVWNNTASADPEIDVPVTPVDDTTGKMSYAFTDLFRALEALGMDNGPDTEHTITFQVVNKYWGDGNFSVNFGSAEAPSSVIFNREGNAKGRLVGYTEIDTF